jgi:anti-sigma-K factor RsiG
MPPPKRRRIDRVTAPDFLAGAGERSVAELRALRDECREEESHLSFARRILQARLDIVRAMVARRSDEGEQDLLEGLPEILADVATRTAPGEARLAPATEPRGTTGGRRTADWLILDASLGRVPDLPDEQLLALVDRLSAEERRVSDLRRIVLDHLDALQAELVRRYAADANAVTDVVSDAVSSAGRSRPAR